MVISDLMPWIMAPSDEGRNNQVYRSNQQINWKMCSYDYNKEKKKICSSRNCRIITLAVLFNLPPTVVTSNYFQYKLPAMMGLQKKTRTSTEWYFPIVLKPWCYIVSRFVLLLREISVKLKKNLNITVLQFNNNAFIFQAFNRNLIPVRIQKRSFSINLWAQ